MPKKRRAPRCATLWLMPRSRFETAPQPNDGSVPPPSRRSSQGMSRLPVHGPANPRELRDVLGASQEPVARPGDEPEMLHCRIHAVWRTDRTMGSLLDREGCSHTGLETYLRHARWFQDRSQAERWSLHNPPPDGYRQRVVCIHAVGVFPWPEWSLGEPAFPDSTLNKDVCFPV